MELSSSGKSSCSSHSVINRKKFVLRVLGPVIRGKSCPICLRHIHIPRAAVLTVCLHAYCIDCIRKWSNMKRKCPLCNSEFHAWFSNVSPSRGKFFKERLPAHIDTSKVVTGGQRFIQRSRCELNNGLRTRVLPWRRSFADSGLGPSNYAAQRVLQWRASIYSRSLQAVPFLSPNCVQQSISGSIGIKEKLLQKIEPWIRRELHAILGDPDPSVIVHVATSLYISSLEQQQIDGGSFLAPLRPFLHDKTSLFWHELRCFAQSSFNMETYDSVVEYKQLDGLHR